MSDELTTEGPAEDPLCPWCSAPLAPTDTVTCSTCGAKLQAEGEQQLPGLTAIDPVAVIEGARAPQRPRNRWVAWLTGSDIEDATAPVASPEALAPPPPEVRREIVRLEMEAELAQLSAEVEALASDEAIAAQDQGDSVRAKAAVAAVLGTEATTEAIKEAAEEAAAEEIAAKEARDAEAAADEAPADAGHASGEAKASDAAATDASIGSSNA